MFDRDTVALIEGAPPLEGLDLESLPRELTEAYASIVSSRVWLRGSSIQLHENRLSEINELISRMQRIAFSQEALVSVAPERSNRASASFVAAAAHHLVFQAEQLLGERDRLTQLEIDRVPSEVSATLLYLVAEQAADASEMAKVIHVPVDQHDVASRLVRALKFLAEGKLSRAASEAESPKTTLVSNLDSAQLDPAQQASDSLYMTILQGVQCLAIRLQGQTASDPRSYFLKARNLAIGGGVKKAIPETYLTIFPGPAHLADLLIAVTSDIESTALTAVPPPAGTDETKWRSVLSRIASSRPYLWRNHRLAIKSGYLTPGTSSVVSFPTGAGKSTLSELKIAAALLRGSKIIFLAPTLALVDQTAKALHTTFPTAEHWRERASGGDITLESAGLSDISVMTPERCLALLSFDPDLFEEVGLLVFDECHIIHPRDGDRSRRAIDSMLCLINFVSVCPSADLLLMSAMLSNGAELAEWISSITTRDCLGLDLNWKPTRQVRGCVVYDAAEIDQLSNSLTVEARKGLTLNPSAELRRKLVASPQGLFCLDQTWQSRSRSHYSLLPLLMGKTQLATGKNLTSWYLTPNGNHVAGRIASAAATSSHSKKGLKTLVFAQTITFVRSAAESISNELGNAKCELTESEKNLRQAAEEELGGREFLYLSFDEQGLLVSSAAPHHGLLLQTERHLHESLYKRADGIAVLVATSTLAQGMNLPSEVVIIAGDSRFDSAANRMERIEAHELLNAAGRAGRAGDRSHGFVLVVPSKVVHFDNSAGTIHKHWSELQAIFSQSDQCLAVEDPIEAVLDQIQLHAQSSGDLADYFIRRLPFSTSGGDGEARRLLSKSMGAYFRAKSGDSAWIQTRIDAALAVRQTQADSFEGRISVQRLAATAGVETSVVADLDDCLAQNPFAGLMTVPEWIAWIFSWLRSDPALLMKIVRTETLEGVFGKTFKSLESDSERGTYALPKIQLLLDAWMQGEPLRELQRLIKPGAKFGRCEDGREFALRLVPELAYAFGLPAQVAAYALADGSEAKVSASTATLSSCVREGVDSVEKLALRKIMGSSHSRPALHREWAAIRSLVPPTPTLETFAACIARVRRARDSQEAVG